LDSYSNCVGCNQACTAGETVNGRTADGTVGRQTCTVNATTSVTGSVT
jgi:hypothetical protein